MLVCITRRKLGDVQNVSLEEANRADGSSPVNNDILRKINAILENSLDISSFCLTATSQDMTQGTRCHSTCHLSVRWHVNIRSFRYRPTECRNIDVHVTKTWQSFAWWRPIAVSCRARAAHSGQFRATRPDAKGHDYVAVEYFTTPPDGVRTWSLVASGRVAVNWPYTTPDGSP